MHLFITTPSGKGYETTQKLERRYFFVFWFKLNKKIYFMYQTNIISNDNYIDRSNQTLLELVGMIDCNNYIDNVS